MRNGVQRTRLRAGVVAGTFTALVAGAIGGAPAAMAAPDDELVWEEGTVTSVTDGDTLKATFDAGQGALGPQYVRTVGVQAPETVDCGGAEAKDRLKAQFPVGSRVQTRAVSVTSHEDDYANYRIVRSLYAQDEEGNWYDTSRPTVSEGWMIWFPFTPGSDEKPEWAHNLEYRVLADDAAASGRGLWSPNVCGASPAASLRVWVSYTQTNTAQPERVFIKNNGSPIDLGGWTVRDSALNYFQIPAGTGVGTGQVLEVQFNEPGHAVAAFPGVSVLVHTNLGAVFNNVPLNNAAFVGDALYLLDNAGAKRTGNLRNWFAYPCNPDSCTDPLNGRVTISKVQWAEPAKTVPSAPRALSAKASTDGSGNVTLTWWPPETAGGAPIDKYVVTTSTQGQPDVVTDAVATSAPDGSLSYVVSGLQVGKGYSFTVTAHNSVGNSSPSEKTKKPVTPSSAGGEGDYSEPTVPGGALTDPWLAGQYVDVTNNTGEAVDLGGYGLWNLPSAATETDKHAYLFPANQQIAANSTLRVHFGSAITQSAAGNVTVLETGLAPFLKTGNDYVELANLNRAQVACVSDGASCRSTTQTSLSTPPVGVTARSSADSVSVSWGGPISKGGTAIAGYEARAWDAAVGGNQVASCSAGGSPSGGSCSFAGSLGTKYYVDVVATNALGSSSPSWRVLATPKTVPTAPGSVSVTGTPGGLNVAWSPAADNGAAITKYTASAYTAGTGGSAVGTCTTSSAAMTNCTIFGLNGGNYYVDVKATNRAGAGAPSSPRVAGAADAGNAVSTYSKGKVTVRWNAPTNAAAAGITGYSAALYTKASGGTKVGSCSAGATATSCKTKKMKKRSKYYIALTVNTTAGAYTVKPRIVTGPAKKASAPKVTSAVPAGKRVVVSWNTPSFNGYSYLKSYGGRLYSKAKGGKVKASCSASASTRTCTTKAVKKGTYYAAARVKNSKGWSSWSKRVKVKVS